MKIFATTQCKNKKKNFDIAKYISWAQRQAHA